MTEEKGQYLATRQDAPLATWAEMKEQAAVLVASRFMPKAVDTAEKALAIMLAGRELGVPPMTAIRSLYVIDGKVAANAQLMLGLAYRTREMEVFDVGDDATSCTVRVKRRGFDEVKIIWTDDDTKRAGLGGGFAWPKYPRVMRRWRAVTEALRLAFPDVLAGVYTADELGLGYKVEDGDIVIDVEPVVIAEPSTKPLTESLTPKLDRPGAMKRIAELQAKVFDLNGDFSAPHLKNRLVKHYQVDSVTKLADEQLVAFGTHLRDLVRDLEAAQDPGLLDGVRVVELS